MWTFWQVAHEGIWWAAGACFVVAFISAVLPWVNAELLVLALPALAGSTGRLAVLVGVVTAGQMLGKCVIYAAARRGLNRPTGRTAGMVQRWRHRLAGSAARCLSLVALSSAFGVPPFYLMSIVAGTLRLDFRWFVAAGTAGRLVRFTLLAFVPRAVAHAL